MTEWHASDDVLARFANAPRTLDAAAASSIETHLIHCDACRQAVRQAVDPGEVAATWSGVAERIDLPRKSIAERLLHRLGFGSDTARVVAATPALRLAGFVAVAAVTATALAAARSTHALGPFLVVAPLAPLGAVGAVFAASADPSGEAGVATPLHGAGLALRRSAVVLTTAFLLLALSSAALPAPSVESAAWVLPSLALSLSALALATQWRAEAIVVVLAGGWVLGVGVDAWFDRFGTPLAQTALFDPAGQVVAATVAGVAALALTVRRDAYGRAEAQL